jgi:hypothetical protein
MGTYGKGRKFVITPAHTKYVEEFCKHGNKSLAYKTAYPNVTHASARTMSVELHKRKEIQDLIAQMQEELAAKSNVTRDTVLADLQSKAELAFLGGQMTAYSSIMNMIIKILGYYAAQGVDITTKGQPITTIKLIEIKKEDGGK